MKNLKNYTEGDPSRTTSYKKNKKLHTRPPIKV